MKKIVSTLLMVAVMAAGVLSFSQNASAEEKMIGSITKIEMAKDGASAIVTLKDDDKEVTLTVNDTETLDKFKDHRINEGDEIRTKFDVIDGKNVSKSFRKTAGC
jgi:Ni/Co efflux regulator RcnB